MTSLSETLPILNEAVPALPTKVEQVARGAEAFETAAHTALADFHQKSQQAETVVEQLRAVLAALHDQAAGDEQRLQAAVQSLDGTVEQQTNAIDEGASELPVAGGDAHTAFGVLQAKLIEAGERTHTAQEEARVALDALGQRAQSSQPEMEGAVHELTAALQSAHQAIAEGQQLVEQGVTSFREHLATLLSSVQDHLQQTHRRLEDLRGEQETVVSEALTELETQRQDIEHEVIQRLDTELRQALDGELDGAMDALGELGQQVTQLHEETELRRADLAQQMTAVGERIPVLQGGVEQVKEAAKRLGIPWP